MFNKPAHKLEPLVEQLKGQQNVIDAVEMALQNRNLKDGLFREVVDIAGTNVTVTGNVINGVPRIGTMYVP